MPYTEFHYTPTGTGVISGKEVLEQTEDAINDLGGQISGDVQTAIDTANNALNTANTASADAQNAVNTANTAYTAATNAQNTANTAQNTASNALTAAQNAQNDVNALGNRVTTAEGNITQNTNAITGLTTRMGTAEGNITTLQNDVITAQGTATSAQNTATLARGQAYVVRYASVAVNDNSTVPYTDLNNTDNIKVNDLLLDINGKFYQITSVDTSNETVSVTTPLTQLAVDSNVMHLSENETASGQKTFSAGTTLNSWLYFTNTLVTKGTIPASTVAPYRIYFGSGTSYGASLFNIDTSVSNTGAQTLTLRSAENVVSGDDTRLTIIYDPTLTQPRCIKFKGDCLPNGDNTYDCGNSSLAWKNVNSYLLSSYGSSTGDEFSGNTRTNLWLMGNRDTKEVSGILFDSYRQNTAQGTGIHILGIGIKENSVRYEGCRWGWYWDNNLNGYSFDFKPTTQGANQAVKHNLGTSTEKWDTINGKNPGALSLPDLDNGIDISGYISTGSSTNDSYTAPADGYLAIIMSSSSTCGMYVYDYSKGFFMRSNSITDSTYNNVCGVFIPVLKNQTMNIASRVTENIVSAKFYPCQGNV